MVTQFCSLLADSQATIRSLQCNNTTAKVTIRGADILNKLASTHKQRITGSCVAVELARRPTLSAINSAHHVVLTLFSAKYQLKSLVDSITDDGVLSHLM